jgi:hypothetical protein
MNRRFGKYRSATNAFGVSKGKSVPIFYSSAGCTILGSFAKIKISNQTYVSVTYT